MAVWVIHVVFFMAVNVSAVCGPIAGETTRETSHPRTCSSFVTCYEYNGPNYGIAYVRATAAGTFWSMNNTAELATPEASCALSK